MRNFLKDINIVGCTLCFREGETIRYCIDRLMEFCDHIVLVLDNQNEETEKIVLEYKEKNPDLFTIGYSGVERSSHNDMPKQRGYLKSRFNALQGHIRQSVLDEVKKVNSKRKIDILVWPDSDEVWSNYFPTALEKFWELKNKSVIFTRPITIYDNFKLIRARTLVPHARVFKYRDDMTSVPYRNKTFCRPFDPIEIVSMHNMLIHIPLLNDKHRKYRMNYISRDTDDTYNLWKSEKDVRDLTPDEYSEIIKGPPAFTIKEYNEKNNISLF